MTQYQKPTTLFEILMGGTVLAFLLLLTVGTVIAVGTATSFQQGLNPSDWAAIRFTILQALTSATLSIMIAIPTARSFSKATISWSSNYDITSGRTLYFASHCRRPWHYSCLGAALV